VLKLVIPGVLGLALLVLSWMSLLRVDNMAHDVAVLRQEVDALKQQRLSHAAGTADAPTTTVAPQPGGLPPVAGNPAPTGSTAVPGAMYEATPARFFSASFAGPQSISLPLPAGTTLRGAQVVIVAIEGEGVAPVVLPTPQPSATLQPGQPQPVAGLCQGPEGAAWVFTLESAAIRIESRGCTYPVRGLRPQLRISTLR
jgi:hypothetical protein